MVTIKFAANQLTILYNYVIIIIISNNDCPSLTWRFLRIGDSS